MPFWRVTWIAKQRAAKQPVAIASEPERRDGAQQWARVEDIMQSAVASAEAAKRLQTAAATQLDAAAYALSRMLAELSAVMKLPAAERTADIHRLEIPARAAVEAEAQKNSIAA